MLLLILVNFETGAVHSDNLHLDVMRLVLAYYHLNGVIFRHTVNCNTLN